MINFTHVKTVRSLKISAAADDILALMSEQNAILQTTHSYDFQLDKKWLYPVMNFTEVCSSRTNSVQVMAWSRADDTLSEPMMTEIIGTIWRHRITINQNGVNTGWNILQF